jgi:hypothetical protein
MASALCTAMPICLAWANSRVQAMIAGVEIKTKNGYEIVWNILYRYMPGFDPTNTVDKPTWDGKGGDVIHYVAAFDLYFRLSAKRGSCYNDFNKSILFLKGITARNLLKIVKQLIIATKSTQGAIGDDGGHLIGHLPHYLRVDKLAQKIAECCKVEPFNQDLGGQPQVHTFTFGNNTTSPTLDSEDDTSRYTKPINGHMQVVPTIVQACRPNGQPGPRMPNTTYLQKADPTHCMQPDQPKVTCNPCGKKEHSANTCDFFAMSVFLQHTSKTAAQQRRQSQTRNVVGSIIGRIKAAHPAQHP